MDDEQCYLSLHVLARQKALGRGSDGPEHSTTFKRSVFAVLYQCCTSDACARLIAIQPWQERYVVEHVESLEQASQYLLGGTVDKVAWGAGKLPSQFIAGRKNNTPVRLNANDLFIG
jgi:hypothetical protein